MSDVKLLAQQIAERLFTNGQGQEATRLVLELSDKRDGGGWCRKAVEDQIAKAIAASNARTAPALPPSPQAWVCAKCGAGSVEHGMPNHPANQCVYEPTLITVPGALTPKQEAADEMFDALAKVKREWPHEAPGDCYSTGPLTGDPIADYVVCPGCDVLRAIEAALAKAGRA